jgi:excinuclease ABC subunit C
MENQALKRLQNLDRAKEATTSPGVYLMKDEHGGILYVGKAKNLRNRLTTYFQSQVHEVPRIEMMVSRVERFDVILTQTESEALILESTLIKKHKPKFNIRLKDDKAYPYLKIRLEESFPRIEWTRRVIKDGARYFGPFPSSGSARLVLRMLNEALQLRDCSDNAFRHRSRPCLLFQMNKCTAPCVGKISPEDYRSTLHDAVAVLEGKDSLLAERLQNEMEAAAEAEEFEHAALIRDQLQSLALVTANQVVDDAGSHRTRDVVGVVREGTDSHAVVLQIRGGKLLSVRHYSLQNMDPSLEDSEVLRDVLLQHYPIGEAAAPIGEGSEGLDLPQEILLPHAPGDLEIFESILRGTTFRIPSDESDEKERQLLQVAVSNARYALEQAVKRSEGHGVEALEEIQEKLHLNRFPERIECYDISNTQGEEAVASRVVFRDGAPDKNLYRRYKIKTVQGSNDFAMMKEVLGRRFANEEDRFPDLVVVDGGKGQLAQAVAILEELGIEDVPVVGLAKARTESDFQAKEVVSSQERIFIPGRKNPIPLLPHTDAYKLLTHIRDEAHRFAITYHRLLRGKRSLG